MRRTRPRRHRLRRRTAMSRPKTSGRRFRRSLLPASRPRRMRTAGGGAHGVAPAGGAGRPRRVGIAIAIAALVLGLSGGIGGASAFRGVAGGDSSVSKISSLDDSAEVKVLPPGAFEKVAKAVMPSVVQINVSGRSGKGWGSGIIISSEGRAE